MPLKADCVPGRKGHLVVVWPENCVPGWMTVWLSLGPESCKVEPSLGCLGLDAGWAGLVSGGQGISPVGEEPWVSVAWALAEATNGASKNSVKSLTSPTRTAPTLTVQHAEHIVAS